MRDGRRKLFQYVDRQSADRVKELYVRRSAEAALVFAFLDRYAPGMDRSGIWSQSVASLAADMGWEDVDELTQIVGSLSDFGIRFDPVAEVFLVVDVANQYWESQGRSANHRTGVAHHISRLPKSPLCDQVLSVWGLNDDLAVSVSNSDNPFSERVKPVASAAFAPLASGGDQ